MEKKNLVEVLLFAAPEPLTDARFNQIIEETNPIELQTLIDELNGEYFTYYKESGNILSKSNYINDERIGESISYYEWEIIDDPTSEDIIDYLIEYTCIENYDNSIDEELLELIDKMSLGG